MALKQEGLKWDLLQAKVRAARDVGQPAPDISEGSYAEREAHYSARAIINLLRKADLSITQLKAPVVVEELRTPEQPVNIELDTLLAEYVPILKVLKKIGSPIPGIDKIIDQLETAIEKAITPYIEGGAKLAGLDLGKDEGGLESTGYVFIGENPDSQGAFDVEDEDGQREFTTVKLFRDDIEELL